MPNAERSVSLCDNPVIEERSEPLESDVTHHYSLLTSIAALVASIYGGGLVWTIKRLLGLERDIATRRAMLNERLAIVSTLQDSLIASIDKAETRNEDSHQRIIEAMDANHKSLTQRLDAINHSIRDGGAHK